MAEAMDVVTPGDLLGGREWSIPLKPGLKSYSMPELGMQNPSYAFEAINPPTAKEAQARLDALFASIEKQGGNLRGVIDVAVSPDSESMEGGVVKKFLIIEK